MPRKPAPRGATSLTQSETPLHRRPLLWLATVGALLLVMGLSLSGPRDGREPATAGDSRVTAIEKPLVAELEPAVPPEPVVEAPAEPPLRDFAVQDGDNLSLIFNRAGFTDTDLYRVARANDDRSLKRIYPGETISFQSNVEGDLLTLRHIQSPLLTTLYSLKGDV